MFNYNIDYVLDIYLSKAIDSGIENISSTSEYYIYIEFKNGFNFNAWNDGKYYAWFARGTFSNSTTEYTWGYSRPSVKTMYRLIKLIQNHIK